MFRYLPLILKNSWRNRRRTTLTILSVGVSMCLLGVLMAIYYAFYFSDPPPEQALRLATRNRVSLAFPMPEFYGDRIRKIPGVREVLIRDWFGGVYKDARDIKNFFPRFATEPDRLFTVYPELHVPEDQKKAFQKERSACAIGRGLAEKHNLKLGDRITLKGDIYPVNLELTVRAIFDADLVNETLFFNRDYLWESMSSRRRGVAGMFAVLADNPEAVPRVIKAIDDQFRNSPVETKTETEHAFGLAFLNAMGNVKMFLLSVCAAVTFTIVLVSANTMAMSVRERVHEVGILRTLGFTPGKILGIILGEAVSIAMMGGIVGYALASVLCLLVRKAPVLFAQVKNLSIPLPVAALCIAIAMLVGFFSSLAPAWNASRLSITDALRSTD